LAKAKFVLDKYDPPNAIGRKRIDARAALDAMIFDFAVGASGTNYLLNFLMIVLFIARSNAGSRMVCLTAFGQSWLRCDDLDGVEWRWQSADAAMAKARFGGDKTGPNPTDRAKPGTKGAC
jgi:hypothetical protein